MYFQVRRPMLFSVIILLATISRSARAELIANAGFEAPVVGGAFTQRDPGDNFGGNGWTVVLGPIDHVHSFWQAAEGSQSMELNGPSAGGISQDLATTPGQKYTIRFALAGNPFGVDDKRLEVLWDGVQIADLTFVQAGHTDIDMGYIYKEVTAVASGGTSTLTFHSLTGAMNGNQGFTTFYGPVIDDLSITSVPEPNSIALSVAGAARAMLLRIRTRRVPTN